MRKTSEGVDMRIYLLDMMKTSDKIISFFKNLLNNEDEYKYITSIKSPKRMCDYVMGRYALKKACEYEGISIDDEKIIKDEKGKPYFKSKKKHFNISHSNNICAVALSEEPIGVDVQNVRDFDERFVEKHFSENEKKIIKNTKSKYFKNMRCTEFWTCKESLLKCVGVGLSVDLSKIDVSKVNCLFQNVQYLVEAFVVNEQYICSGCERKKDKDKIIEDVIELEA